MGTCLEVRGQFCGLIDVGLWDYEPETGKAGFPGQKQVKLGVVRCTASPNI